MRGEIVAEGKVLLIRRIHVTYHLRADASDRQTIEKVHRVHMDFCPVARSISPCIEIETDVEIE